MLKHEKVEFRGVIYTSYPNGKRNKQKYFKDRDNNYLHRKLWEFYFGEIPKGYHIHHKDGGMRNNSLDNLECLTPRDHCKAHSLLAKSDPAKDIYESRRRWQKSLEGLRHHSKLGKLNWLKKEKALFPCDKCGVLCERFKDHVKKVSCEECKAVRKSAYKKKNYTPKEKKTYESFCKICGKQIVQKTRKPKELCSVICKSKSRLIQGVDDIIRKCLVCGLEFKINKYSKTKTCGGVCRGKYISLRMS